MRLCLYLWLACGLLQAAGVEIPRRVASVVRVDPKTGQLVRAVKALPEPAAPAAKSAQPDRDLGRFIEETARQYELDPLLVHSVIQVESNYNPLAVSPKGAQGLMQLMPGTARRFEVKNSFNPWENLQGGVRYLKYLMTLFEDPQLALAAYNAGEQAVFKYGSIPPYPETRQYVQNVSRRYGRAKGESAPLASGKPSEPRPPRVEQYEDADGVLHVRTLPSP